MESVPVRGLLNEPLALPLLPEATVVEFGRTLVIAPHPDDESLGCGGAVALLHRFGVPVHVVVMTDGTLSHPHSRAFPAPRLKALREDEARAAVRILGGAEGTVEFLGLRDRRMPANGTTEWTKAVAQCRSMIEGLEPRTIMLPWRRDPHPDHRATWELIQAALHEATAARPRMIEYPIWLWEMAEEADLPRAAEVRGWRLAIDRVVEQKQAAIAAHRSQTTTLIDDDPEGFRLMPDMLAHFAQGWEIYLEETV
ncbi:MAG: PIG-L family deacetylase [Herpetosiphon sp.]